MNVETKLSIVAEQFVKNCNTETLDLLKSNPNSSLESINAIDVLFAHQEIEDMIDNTDETGQTQYVCQTYCGFLNEEFKQQHNLSTQIY